MPIFLRAIVPVLLATLWLATPITARAQGASQDQPSEETWNSIKGDILKDRPVLDGTGLVVLDAPRRAEDAAVVPIGMRVNLGGDDKRTLKSLTLVIDENPAPVVIFKSGAVQRRECRCFVSTEGKITVGRHVTFTRVGVSEHHVVLGRNVFVEPKLVLSEQFVGNGQQGPVIADAQQLRFETQIGVTSPINFV